MRCPACGEQTNPTMVYCIVCGVPIETDLATIQRAAEIEARELRAKEAVKEARELLWLGLFLFGCVVALRQVLLRDVTHLEYPAYRISAEVVRDAMKEPRADLPVDTFALEIPDDE